MSLSWLGSLQRRSEISIAIGFVFVLGSLVQTIGVMAATYTDEATWRAAAGSWVLEDFEGISPGTQVSSLPGLGVSFDTLNDNVTFPSVQLRSSTGGFAVSGSNIFLNDIDFATPGRGPITLQPLNSGDGITAIGYWNTGGDDTTILMLDRHGNPLESLESGLGLTFVGIVSAIPATNAVISPGMGNTYFTIDDLQLTLGLIPEPSTFILAAFVLLGMGFRRKKRA